MHLTMSYFEMNAVDNVSKERVKQMRLQMNFYNSMQKFYRILDGFQLDE